MNRRDFIAGAATLLGWGMCGRAFAALPGAFSQGRPNLVFGVISDIHIRLNRKKGRKDTFEREDLFRRTLEWFRDQGVDAVTISGDMADHGLLEELDAVGRIWFSVFPDDKAPDGRRVERLFVYGNHDWEGFKYGDAGKKTFGDDFERHTIRADLAAAWKRAFREDYAPVWRKDVKGYTFIGAHWTADRCRGREEIGVPQAPEWFKENGHTIDPSKPFFYLQHPPPKNACHGPWLWGHDDGRLTEALSAFPNAVALTGHSHAPIADERAIWQGAFTSIDAGALRNVSFEYGDMDPVGRENDKNRLSASAEDPYRVMKAMSASDGHQGMLARVFDDRIVFERRDLEDMGTVGPDWVVPLPVKAPPAFAFEPRAAASVAPEFPAGAALKVRLTTGRNRGGKNVKAEEQGVLEVTIPAANGAGSGRVFDYALELSGADGAKETRYVIAEGCYRSPGSERANSPTVCLLAVRRLKVSGEVELRVVPRNCFGKAGGAIGLRCEINLPETGALPPGGERGNK